MTPEKELSERVRKLFDMRNLSEIARRTGYPKTTLSQWKRKPLSIPALALITLERLLK